MGAPYARGSGVTLGTGRTPASEGSRCARRRRKSSSVVRGRPDRPTGNPLHSPVERRQFFPFSVFASTARARRARAARSFVTRRTRVPTIGVHVPYGPTKTLRSLRIHLRSLEESRRDTRAHITFGYARLSRNRDCINPRRAPSSISAQFYEYVPRSHYVSLPNRQISQSRHFQILPAILFL